MIDPAFLLIVGGLLAGFLTVVFFWGKHEGEHNVEEQNAKDINDSLKKQAEIDSRPAADVHTVFNKLRKPKD